VTIWKFAPWVTHHGVSTSTSIRKRSRTKSARSEKRFDKAFPLCPIYLSCYTNIDRSLVNVNYYQVYFQVFLYKAFYTSGLVILQDEVIRDFRWLLQEDLLKLLDDKTRKSLQRILYDEEP